MRPRLPCIALAALALAIFSSSLPTTAADESTLYVHRDTWQDSLRESLQNLAALEDAERAEAEKTGQADLVLGPWNVIGSFSNTGGKGFATAYPPEQETVLDQTYEGMSDSQAAWRRMDSFVDGEVHNLLPHFRLTEWAIAYLQRNITARQAMEITGYFGSDDGLAVWLNGEKLISNDVPRGPGPDQDKAALKLRQGENSLLMKIVNQTGGWGFYFSTKPGGGSPEDNPTHRRRVNMIWDRVRTDSTGPEDQRQIRDESDDGIWPLNWHPADTASLARRYADAARGHLVQADQELQGLVSDLGESGAAIATVRTAAVNSKAKPDDGDVPTARQLYHRSIRLRAGLAGLARLVSLGLAVDDLAQTYGERYGQAGELRRERDQLWARGQELLAQEAGAMRCAPAEALDKWEQAVTGLQQQALITANPLLDFGRLIYLTRKPGGGTPGLPQNWQSNSSIGRAGYDTAINVLSPVSPEGQVSEVYHSTREFVGDLELSFDATRLLFSMPARDKADRYQVWETGTDGQGLRMVTRDAENDYDNYDACYLPNGQIMFTSSRCYQAVPCTGGDHVALMYLMDDDGGNVRQLSFDQDHSWNPTMLNDGRVIYSRWEYNDLPHYFSRILFTMNPDGTRQMAFYGTNSYFPNTAMYARPVPGSNTKISCILSGHHGNPRMGELAVVDTAVGEQEAEGVVRIIPQRHRKIGPAIIDQYATGQWPQFVQPFPLSDKYFLVSCKEKESGWWGIYLADVFDNLVPIRVEPGAALMEPIPLRPTPVPTTIPNGVDLTRNDGVVYLFDVYRGPGLEGVQRGSIKKLRLIEPVYRYWGNGETHSTSLDGGWDVKRILGTVPVETDGSAYFRVPANTPIVVQPLNDKNMAQQQMRSWFTAMPGENLSCVGCHERRRDIPASGLRSEAQRRGPSEIEEWYGPARGFAFETEIQPVLDRSCLRCHDKAGALDFRSRAAAGETDTRFSPAYRSLHPFVRRPGLESDIRLLPPREFEANTSQLVQMLRKGHKGVKLSAEEWDRLITWIDLNIPYAGNWKDAYPPAPDNLIARREELRKQDAWTRVQDVRARDTRVHAQAEADR